jgi:hypothetical protein
VKWGFSLAPTPRISSEGAVTKQSSTSNGSRMVRDRMHAKFVRVAAASRID